MRPWSIRSCAVARRSAGASGVGVDALGGGSAGVATAAAVDDPGAARDFAGPRRLGGRSVAPRAPAGAVTTAGAGGGGPAAAGEASGPARGAGIVGVGAAA